jgi:hypothetical protein
MAKDDAILKLIAWYFDVIYSVYFDWIKFVVHDTNKFIFDT